MPGIRIPWVTVGSPAEALALRPAASRAGGAQTRRRRD